MSASEERQLVLKARMVFAGPGGVLTVATGTPIVDALERTLDRLEATERALKDELAEWNPSERPTLMAENRRLESALADMKKALETIAWYPTAEVVRKIARDALAASSGEPDTQEPLTDEALMEARRLMAQLAERTEHEKVRQVLRSANHEIALAQRYLRAALPAEEPQTIEEES